MADREWLRSFENAKRLLDSIRVDIVDSEHSSSANSGIEVRRGLKKLDHEIQLLRESLEASSAELPVREQARRKQVLQMLQHERDALDSRQSAASSRDKKALVSTSAVALSAGEVAALPVDEQAVLRQQRDLLQRQDEDLEALHESVLRTKNVGMLIGNEIMEHNRLLTGLQTDVDITSQRMASERRRMEKLLKRSRSGCGVCVLILLIVGLVFLMLVVLGVIHL
eukprot:RCo005865